MTFGPVLMVPMPPDFSNKKRGRGTHVVVAPYFFLTTLNRKCLYKKMCFFFGFVPPKKKKRISLSARDDGTG